MSGFASRVPEPAFDLGFARARVPAPQPRERSTEDKAGGANTIAGNLDHYYQIVNDSVAAMATAAIAEDLAGWTAARKAADAGLTQIRSTAVSALASATEATDPRVRRRLAGAQHLLEDATTLLERAPAAPALRAPVITCADALLAVLPPDQPVDRAEPVFAAAERAVEAIFRSQMTHADITAFHTICRDHKDHEITCRFARFGTQRRTRLVGILGESSVKTRARAMEAAQRKARRDDIADAPARSIALASQDKLSASSPTPDASGAADAHVTTDRPEPAATVHHSVRGDTAESATNPLHLPVAAKPAAEPRGAAIAARVPGVTYEGTGRFRVATRDRHLDVAIERVQTGAARVRRSAGDAVVLDVPTGLGEAEFAQAVAEQLRALHEQLSGAPGGGAGGLGPILPSSGTPRATPDATPVAAPPASGLPYRAEMEQSFGRSLGHVRAYTGMTSELAAHGAQALATGDAVAFADAQPSPELVAHEVAHVVQNEQAGTAAPMAAGAVAPRDSAAEFEADAIAGQVAAHGPGTRLPPITAAPAAHIQLSPKPSGGTARDAHPNSVGAREFLRWGWPPGSDDMRKVLIDLKFIDAAPYAKYLQSSAEAYHGLFTAVLGAFPDIDALIAPKPLLPLVDRARGRDWDQETDSSPPFQTTAGPMEYVYWLPVALELGNAIARHYRESIERMFPRFASLVVQKNPNRAAEATPRIFQPVREAEILVSHPMDRLIQRVLSEYQAPGRGIAFDAAVSDHPEFASAEHMQSRPVFLRRPPRLWHWIEASPANRTQEEVATALFGKPEEAYRLIPLPPLWGYRASDVEAFVPAQREALNADFQKAWGMTGGEGLPKEIQAALGQLWGDQAPEQIDPVAELVADRGGKLAMDRASATVEKARAPGTPRTGEAHDEASIVEVLDQNLTNLDDLARLMPLFQRPVAPVNAARALVTQRRDEAAKQRLTHPETRFALADQQRPLLVRIVTGMADVGGRLAVAGGTVASPAARGPLTDVADAYLAAITAIELPELAGLRVEAADALLRDIEITLQEAALHQSVAELNSEWSAPGPSHRDDDATWAAKHGAKERADEDLRRYQDYATALGRAHVAMITDPTKTSAATLAMKPKVDDLGFEIGIDEKLARLDEIWSAIEGQEDVWESQHDEDLGHRLKATNRRLYLTFKTTVYEPFRKAQQAADPEGKKAARSAYRDLLTGSEMQEHAKAVNDFLKGVAKHKKWTKFVVGLAVAFVAFGLGQWQFGAMLAADATVFEAAIGAGLITTGTTAALNKAIFDQNPTMTNLLVSFVANAGTFFVIGKLALAAKAAGVEAAVSEGTAEAAASAGGAGGAATGGRTAGQVARGVGAYAGGLAKEAMIAEALGLAQAEVEKLLAEHKTLSAEEVEDLLFQQLVAVVGMRVACHVTDSDLFRFRSADQRLAAEIDWLATEQKALQAAGKELHDHAAAAPHGRPDRAAAAALIARWRTYLEREQAVRARILELAEKHPERFKNGDIAKLRATKTDPSIARQLQEAQALLSIEQSGVNRYTCDPSALDAVLAQHKAAGSEIVRIATDARTGQRTVTIRPADGTPAIKITERLPPVGKRVAARVPVGDARHFEQWLDHRDQAPSKAKGQAQLRELYLRDPEAAMNLAAERHGYQPTSLASPELIVKPDAPGEAGKTPVDPMVTPAQHAVAGKLGPDVTAIGNDRYLAPPTRLAEMRATWQSLKGANVSKIHYDAETNTSYFEADVDAKRVRVEAPLAPRIESFAQIDAGKNRIIGKPIAAADGPGILRALVKRDATALNALGLGDAARMPGRLEIEFGLGETSDGRVVLIRGEEHAVDWSALPGVKPTGHTHPSVKNNDLPERDGSGRREISLDKLVRPTKDPLLVRELIFPSADDFIVMAHLGIDGHRVYTPFIVRDGMVMKPGAGESGPRLEFTIGQPKEVGNLPDGRQVYKSRVKGTVEGDTGKPPIEADVWIVRDEGGASGHLHMAEPAEMIPTASPGGKPATRTRAKVLTPALENLAKQYGEPVVQWAHDSLREADVAPLLKELAPTTLATIADIPATEAAALVLLVTAKRVNNALSLGPSGPVRGKQLEALRRQVVPAVLVDLLDSATTQAGRLTRLARIADGLEPASALLHAKPLGAGSVAIDTNVLISVDQLVRGVDKKGKKIEKFADLDESCQNAINGVRQARGLGAYIDPPAGTHPSVDSIVGPGADLRTTLIPGAEAMVNETPTNQSPALATMKGIRTNRIHADYELVLEDLKNASVGTSKGAADRSLVLDAMFADNISGNVPKLVTADADVCLALARKFVTSPRTFVPTGTGGIPHWDQLLARFPEGRFTVEIRGHKLEVYFHAEVHHPPYAP